MSSTFSESWFRIAGLRITLRPSVRVRKQHYRGEASYVIHDPHNKSFYRLSPAAYHFVAALSFSSTVEEVWLAEMQRNPEYAPGQQDVLSLLIELNNENLLSLQSTHDSEQLLARAGEKERRQSTSRLKNVLFLHIPLLNPDRFLSKLDWLWKLLFSRGGLLCWLVVVALAVRAAAENSGLLIAEASQVLAPSNLPLLYCGLVLVKLFHELGHGSACKRFGGEVSSVGVMLLLFVPLPFVDATSSWELRNRWERILVSSAGMLFEFFLGGLACLLWANSPPGAVHSLAVNMMITATVSTVLFNSNPLLRYDGYYILVDLLEIPNLYEKSRMQLYGMLKRVLFGLRDTELPGQGLRESGWLLSYGLASMVYRVILLATILMLVAGQYGTIGMAVALLLGLSWLLAPVLRLLKFLFLDPQLNHRRLRAMLVVGLCFCLPLSMVLSYPLPTRIVLPGIVESGQRSEVLAETGGRLQELAARPGIKVRRGQPLLVLSNPVLDHDIARVQSQLAQISLLEQRALVDGGGDRSPLAKRREASLMLLADLENNRKKLTVTAQQDGIWVVRERIDLVGQWVNKGHSFGEIIDESRFRFSAVVSQEESADLFGEAPGSLEVRLHGGDQPLTVKDYQLQPHAHDILPDQALGWMAGGSVPTRRDDPQGLRTNEPFYLFSATLENGATLRCGRTGSLRIILAPQPLGLRLYRYGRQFLQKRYQLL